MVPRRHRDDTGQRDLRTVVVSESGGGLLPKSGGETGARRRNVHHSSSNTPGLAEPPMPRWFSSARRRASTGRPLNVGLLRGLTRCVHKKVCAKHLSPPYYYCCYYYYYYDD